MYVCMCMCICIPTTRYWINACLATSCESARLGFGASMPSRNLGLSLGASFEDAKGLMFSCETAT